MSRKLLPFVRTSLITLSFTGLTLAFLPLLTGCDKVERWGSPWAVGSAGASAAVEPGAHPAGASSSAGAAAHH